MPGPLGMLAAGTAAGIFTGAIENQRQLKQQERMNEMSQRQHGIYNEMNRQSQLQLWKDTNYKAQIEQMELAGVNPALLYGGKGGGGITAAAATGGEAQPTATKGNDIITGMGMGLQSGMMQAQVDLIRAQTEKTKVETAKTAGVDTENVQANTANTKIQTALGEIQKEIQGESIKALKYIITGEAEKLFQEVNIMRNQGIINENTTMAKIQMIEEELTGMVLRNELTRSNIQVNDAQINKWAQELRNAAIGLGQSERNVKVNEKLAEFNTSLSREALGALGGVISTIIGKGMTKGTKIENKRTDIHINRGE